jgi:peptide/nickel transport system permease protein
VLSLNEMTYIEAARGLGASHRRLMLRHILPRASHPPNPRNQPSGVTIIIEAALGFGGVGHSAARPDLGQYAV